MDDARSLVFLRRSLVISGAIAVALLLTIPLSASLRIGDALGEGATVVWDLSIVAVVVGAHRLVGRGRPASQVAALVGVVAIIVMVIALLFAISGLATSLGVGPFTALASALIGVWLVATSRALVRAGLVPASIGWVGVASGAATVVTYVLLQVGGFPTSTDPSAISTMSPFTIVAAMLSLLSIPLYAVWAIWAARRLPKPA